MRRFKTFTGIVHVSFSGVIRKYNAYAAKRFMDSLRQQQKHPAMQLHPNINARHKQHWAPKACSSTKSKQYWEHHYGA